MSDTAITNAQAFVNEYNEAYAKAHQLFEEQFWGTKMALKDSGTYSVELLSKTKADMENLLSDPKVLENAQKHRDAISITENDSNLCKTLDIIIKTCICYDMSSNPEAKSIREQTVKLESELGSARNNMKLGLYKSVEGNDEKIFEEMSSVGLRNIIRTSSDEKIRLAAYEGLRSIGPFVCDNGFVEIVKLRNKLARALGKEDYYEYKIQSSEGFSKKTLFEILDSLEIKTRDTVQKARAELERRYGKTSLEPHNMSFMMRGSIVQKMDPYFPFAKAVERYARSFAAMKIDYKGATLCLDLLDRKGKYSNGFCHWPVCAWEKPDGTFCPSKTNFTSLADPAAVGSGMTALTTLMHEAGHAAHFANVKQPSPLFSQERAPTSVAYAENQSMFLDSLVGDAAWRAKYAHDLNGNPIPFEIIEEEIRASHPFEVFALRAMLTVSYFEKALYELPEEEVTAENILKLADQVECDISGGFSPRPLLSVPHIISDEASCYYQGYTLAEMSVHQTRAWFKSKYGYIVDNPEVGPTLEKSYWECGNSKQFLDIVRDLTGKDLTGDEWTNSLNESVEDRIASEREEYNKAIESHKEMTSDIDLNMTVEFRDGDLLIANSSGDGFLSACKEFEDFIATRVLEATA